MYDQHSLRLSQSPKFNNLNNQIDDQISKTSHKISPYSIDYIVKDLGTVKEPLDQMERDKSKELCNQFNCAAVPGNESSESHMKPESNSQLQQIITNVEIVSDSKLAVKQGIQVIENIDLTNENYCHLDQVNSMQKRQISNYYTVDSNEKFTTAYIPVKDQKTPKNEYFYSGHDNSQINLPSDMQTVNPRIQETGTPYYTEIGQMKPQATSKLRNENDPQLVQGVETPTQQRSVITENPYNNRYPETYPTKQMATIESKGSYLHSNQSLNQETAYCGEIFQEPYTSVEPVSTIQHYQEAKNVYSADCSRMDAYQVKAQTGNGPLIEPSSSFKLFKNDNSQQINEPQYCVQENQQLEPIYYSEGHSSERSTQFDERLSQPFIQEQNFKGDLENIVVKTNPYYGGEIQILEDTDHGKCTNNVNKTSIAVNTYYKDVQQNCTIPKETLDNKYPTIVKPIPKDIRNMESFKDVENPKKNNWIFDNRTQGVLCQESPNVQKCYQLHIIDSDQSSSNVKLEPLKIYAGDSDIVGTPATAQKNIRDIRKNEPTDDITLSSILGLKSKVDKNSVRTEKIRQDDKVIKGRPRKTKCDVPTVPFKIAPVTSINIPVPHKSKKFLKTINSVYTSADKCTEVKHARTPLQKLDTSLQTHTPLLPTPSNYPIQIESSNCHKNTILPNVSVPKSEILKTPQITSQLHVNQTHSLELIKSHSYKYSEKLNKNLNQLKKTEIKLQSTSQKSNNAVRVEGKTENNFTVLNVPNVHPKSTFFNRRLKTSRIEYAMKKRKKRKQTNSTKPKKSIKLIEEAENVVTLEWGIPVIGYNSDTSSSYNSSDYESDNCEIDLEIKSGPPEKPTPEKIRFLNSFGIATPDQRDSVEIDKMKSRQWMTPWILSNKEVDSKILPLNLPVPSHTPLLLNKTPEYKKKAMFLKDLGLIVVTPYEQRDFEQNWVKVIHDRLKRDCESPLTKYSINAYRKQQFSILKPNVLQKFRKKQPSNEDYIEDTRNIIPFVHQYVQQKKEDCNLNRDLRHNILSDMVSCKSSYSQGKSGDRTYAMVVFIDKD